MCKIHTVSLGEKMRHSAFVAEYLKFIPCYMAVFVQILLEITVEKPFKCLTMTSLVAEFFVGFEVKTPCGVRTLVFGE